MRVRRPEGLAGRMSKPFIVVGGVTPSGWCGARAQCLASLRPRLLGQPPGPTTRVCRFARLHAVRMKEGGSPPDESDFKNSGSGMRQLCPFRARKSGPGELGKDAAKTARWVDASWPGVWSAERRGVP